MFIVRFVTRTLMIVSLAYIYADLISCMLSFIPDGYTREAIVTQQ
ncbi:hypothetical protein SAMN04488522_103525 [Pedobacter caeni]|uniref:Uncharacterized protein n=1 Tax=Pedobacter caeni TaxID=288992 RepID=A0A1M5E6S4_9SPHI|nr:hypothetical protein SAMN04488522_103525 [Pedobacter caeni]